MWTIFCDTL
jgi:hypothetical protein